MYGRKILLVKAKVIFCMSRSSSELHPARSGCFRSGACKRIWRPCGQGKAEVGWVQRHWSHVHDNFQEGTVRLLLDVSVAEVWNSRGTAPENCPPSRGKSFPRPIRCHVAIMWCPSKTLIEP